MAGAQEVTAIDSNWETWPLNIQYASQVWQVQPKIITADFRTYDFQQELGFYYQPEFYFLDGDGNLIKKLIGYISEEEFRSLFDSNLE